MSRYSFDNINSERYGKYKLPSMLLIIILSALVEIMLRLLEVPGLEYVQLMFAPAIIAGIWYGRRSIPLILCLGLIQISTTIFILGIWNPLAFLNSISLYLVGFLVALMTDRRNRLSRNLKTTNKKQQMIIDFLPDATMIIDIEGRVIGWNKAMEKLSGVAAADIIGRGDHEYSLWIHGVRKPMLIDFVDMSSILYMLSNDIGEKYPRIIVNDGKLEIPELKVNRNNTEIVLYCSATCLYDDEGIRIGAIESMRDVTEQSRVRHELEQQYEKLGVQHGELQKRDTEIEKHNVTLKSLYSELKEKNNELQRIIEFLPDAVIIIDKNGKVVAWNRAIEEMTGCAAEKMIGVDNLNYSVPIYGYKRPMLVNMLNAPDTALKDLYANVSRSKDGILEAQCMKAYLKDRERILHARACRLLDSNGNNVGAIESLRDITDQWHTDEKLQQQYAELTAQNEELQQQEEELVSHNNVLNELYQKLSVSEMNYRMIFDSANDGIVILDALTGAVLDCNEMWSKISGYGKQDSLELPSAMPGCGEGGYTDRKSSYYIHRAAVEGRLMFSWNLRRKDGACIWVEISMNRIRFLEEERLIAVVRDVSERRRASEEQESLLSLLNATLESTADGIMVTDLESRVIRMNNKCRSIWSLSEDLTESETKQKTLYAMTGKVKDPGPFFTRISHIYKDSLAESFDIIELSDGRQLERFSQPLMLRGQPVGRVWSFRDISERLLAQKDIIENEKRFRALAESTTAAIVIAQNGKLIYANSAAAILSGYTVEELKNMPQGGMSIFNPDQINSIPDILNRPHDTAGVETFEIEFRKKDGAGCWLEISANSFEYYDTRSVLFSAFDITERKKREKELRTLLTAVEFSPSSVIIFDIEGIITYVNPRFVETSGYQSDEVLGKDYSSLCIENMNREDMRRFNEHVVEGKVWHSEYLQRKRDGTEYWVSASVSPVRDDKNHIVQYIAVQEDISERKQAEERVIASLHEKELLLKEIHHRVKNNLQVVSSMLSLQSMQLEDAAIVDMFLSSQSRIRSMALIHEKLYQSRDLARVDFNEYVRNLTKYLMRSYNVNQGTVKLNIDIEEILLGVDHAIPCGLIINELVSNALKYAFPGNRGGQITVNMRKESGEYMLIVSDDGVGIPETVDHQNTTSLGLQLVNTLIDQLEGSIYLSRDKGTTFKITFRD